MSAEPRPKLAFLRAAFVSGYHTNEDTNTAKIWQQDGCVSSLVTFTFILALGFSICVCHWITLNNQTKDVDRASVDFLQITYMLFPIVIMLILMSSKCVNHLYANRKTEGNGISQPGENQQMEMRPFREQHDSKVIRYLPCIGLVWFYVAGMFLDIFRIGAHCLCWETFRQCHLLRHYIVSIAYHLIKIFFMGVLMVFCIFFKEKVMLQCWQTRFSVQFIIAAAAVVWFDVTLYDAHVIFSSKEDIMDNACHLPNASHLVLLGQLDMRCVNESTDLYYWVHEISPYFYPLNIEFLLVCIEILIKLFFTMKNQSVIDQWKREGQRNNGQQQCPQDDASAPLLAVARDDRQEADAGKAANYGAIEGDQRRNVPEPHGANDVQSQREPSPNTTWVPSPNTTWVAFAIWCLIAGIANVVFMAFGFLTYLKQAHDIWNDIYQIAKIIYWIPLIMAIFIAYHAMQDMAPDSHEFNGLELTVVFANAGFALYVFFPLISAVSVMEGSLPVIPDYHNDTFSPWHNLYEYPKSYIPHLIIPDKLLNIIQVFFQSNLLLQAARVKRRLDNESSRRNTCFSVAIMYLVMCNLT